MNSCPYFRIPKLFTARPGPVHILNIIRLRDQADYPDGREATGIEAYAAYSEISATIFPRLSGKIAWGDGYELMMDGPESEQWEVCFVAEYPSVQNFVEMLRDPGYREAMKHRQAVVADSRSIRLQPLELGSTIGHGLAS